MLHIVCQAVMQIKTRYHYPSGCVTKLWNNDNSKCGTTGTLILEGKTVQPLWRTAWWFLTKVNILLPYDPAIMHFSLVNSMKGWYRSTFYYEHLHCLHYI